MATIVGIQPVHSQGNNRLGFRTILFRDLCLNFERPSFSNHNANIQCVFWGLKPTFMVKNDGNIHKIIQNPYL
jgi:hypothetical protein